MMLMDHLILKRKTWIDSISIKLTMSGGMKSSKQWTIWLAMFYQVHNSMALYRRPPGWPSQLDASLLVQYHLLWSKWTWPLKWFFSPKQHFVVMMLFLVCYPLNIVYKMSGQEKRMFHCVTSKRNPNLKEMISQVLKILLLYTFLCDC